jgi:hypothetical protein
MKFIGDGDEIAHQSKVEIHAQPASLWAQGGERRHCRP